MARRATAADAFSHWDHLLEHLQAVPSEFYTAVEQALEPRQLPDTTRERVDWREGGMFSARREYLRVRRARHAIDICGAPFGSGFFVSWWLAETRPGALIPTIMALVAIGVLGWIFSAIGGTTFALFGLVVVFLGFGTLMSQGEQEWHAYLLAVPILGFLWERFFLPATYYRIDTALMFQEAVHRAVLEVVDRLTEAQGLRRLTDLERKPILRDFYRR